MQQKILYVLCFLTCLVFIHAPVSGQKQAALYTLTASSVTYTHVVGNPLPIGGGGGAFTSPITIGFTFVFEGFNYTQVRVSEDGYFTFNPSASTSLSGSDLKYVAAVNRPLIAPLWGNQEGKGGSYSLTGTAPNRVFSLEWFQWEWDFSVTSPVISYQVKLYEGTNEIEFIYQQEATPPPSFARASIGISGIGTFLSLQNTSASPTVSSVMDYQLINTRPATGQLYRFSPPEPICHSSSNPTIGKTTTTTAEVDWTTGSGSNWNIQYGLKGFVVGSGIKKINVNKPYTIVGLLPSTAYDVYIQDSCADGKVSDWSDSLSFVTDTVTTGINKVENLAFSFFPNPVVDHLIIQWSIEEMKDLSLTITNTSGVEVYRKKVAKQSAQRKITVDVSGMAAGIYWLSATTASQTIVKKLIIQ